ncbi:MAG: helix-turn-helix transcriptional regulator [Acidobacteriota bacterium]
MAASALNGGRSADPVRAQTLTLYDLRDAYHRRRAPDIDHLPADVAGLVRCIHRHLFEPTTNVASVKARCGIRRHSIGGRFRAAVGRGMRDHIEDRRLGAAAFLLRETSADVCDIALAVGYEHEETFYRAFRRRRGLTPSAYRRDQGRPVLPQRQGSTVPGKKCQERRSVRF